jgi:molecular chaperone GrpE
VGQPFDPERHEAVARVQRPDLPDMTVAAETARGYLLHGRVLRPAMVTVAVAPEEREPGADS